MGEEEEEEEEEERGRIAAMRIRCAVRVKFKKYRPRNGRAGESLTARDERKERERVGISECRASE